MRVEAEGIASAIDRVGRPAFAPPSPAITDRRGFSSVPPVNAAYRSWSGDGPASPSDPSGRHLARAALLMLKRYKDDTTVEAAERLLDEGDMAGAETGTAS